MHRSSLFLIAAAGLLVATGTAPASTPPHTAQVTPTQSAADPAADRSRPQELVLGATRRPDGEQAPGTRSCADLVSAGEDELALAACRHELESDPSSLPMARQLAELEFKAGDPMRSAELWQAVIDRHGWSYEAARGKAMAIWRGGAPLEAETVFRQTMERAPTPASHEDMISYLLSFDRCSEAAELTQKSAERFPEHCWFIETLGVAEACQDNHARAAELFAKTMETDCSRYGWTRRGSVSHQIERAEYQALLDPAELVEGLRQLDDVECQHRLGLLKHVMTASVVPAVTTEVLERTKASVRLAGLGLLCKVGSAALPSWKALLKSDDFILRRHALRRIRELHDPAFIPLVQEHLEREPLPRNKNITRLVLGELLLDTDRADRGEALLREIPADDLRFPVARLVLSERAEAQGDHALALQLVDEAKAADPNVFVAAERIDRLREALGPPAEEPRGRSEPDSGESRGPAPAQER